MAMSVGINICNIFTKAQEKKMRDRLDVKGKRKKKRKRKVKAEKVKPEKKTMQLHTVDGGLSNINENIAEEVAKEVEITEQPISVDEEEE